MTNTEKNPLILAIDDDLDVLRLIDHYLTSGGYDVITAETGTEGLEIADETKPDLILLDVVMPEMDGYEVCTALQQNDRTSNIPIVFVTIRGDDHDQNSALAMGAVDYVVKPIQKEVLLEKVILHQETANRWKQLDNNLPTQHESGSTRDFAGFIDYFVEQHVLSEKAKQGLSEVTSSEIYSLTADVGIGGRVVARYIADFLNLPYVAQVEPDDVRLGVLSGPFCKTNHVIPVSETYGENAFVLSNPFEWKLLDMLGELLDAEVKPTLLVSEPDSIEMLVAFTTSETTQTTVKAGNSRLGKFAKIGLEKGAIVSVAESILNKAVFERASDIHIEPKQSKCVVRFRVDGELKEVYSMENENGAQLISRLKLIGGLDVAESRRPQDGGCGIVINKRDFSLRMSTTSTPNGESIAIRLLEPYAKPRGLKHMGMTESQVNTSRELAACPGGGIVVVGPTGCGKTTTIFNLLSTVDYNLRSVLSVEDPVEYQIHFANQQQVNEKAGITFEALLKAAVRQDPDVLFIGEIRDPHSAKIAMDFSSTGHLTVTSLHTSNATTAIARLERLGIDRSAMSESIIGVIAQRLMKKLCVHCREVVPISEEEVRMLSPFTDQVPTQVAHPCGCPACNNTGYYGCEGTYEILEFDGAISEMIRSGISIAEIRYFIRNRGDYLISNHAVEKVKDLVCAPEDAYEKVLVEEIKLKGLQPGNSNAGVSISSAGQAPNHTGSTSASKGAASILIVEDDEDTRNLIVRIVQDQGYSVQGSIRSGYFRYRNAQYGWFPTRSSNATERDRTSTSVPHLPRRFGRRRKRINFGGG